MYSTVSYEYLLKHPGDCTGIHHLHDIRGINTIKHTEMTSVWDRKRYSTSRNNIRGQKNSNQFVLAGTADKNGFVCAKLDSALTLCCCALLEYFEINDRTSEHWAMVVTSSRNDAPRSSRLGEKCEAIDSVLNCRCGGSCDSLWLPSLATSRETLLSDWNFPNDPNNSGIRFTPEVMASHSLSKSYAIRSEMLESCL